MSLFEGVNQARTRRQFLHAPRGGRCGGGLAPAAPATGAPRAVHDLAAFLALREAGARAPVLRRRHAVTTLLAVLTERHAVTALLLAIFPLQAFTLDLHGDLRSRIRPRHRRQPRHGRGVRPGPGRGAWGGVRPRRGPAAGGEHLDVRAIPEALRRPRAVDGEGHGARPHARVPPGLAGPGDPVVPRHLAAVARDVPPLDEAALPGNARRQAELHLEVHGVAVLAGPHAARALAVPDVGVAHGARRDVAALRVGGVHGRAVEQ